MHMITPKNVYKMQMYDFSILITAEIILVLTQRL